MFWAGHDLQVPCKEIKEIDLGRWSARVYEGQDLARPFPIRFLLAVLDKTNGTTVFQVSSEPGDPDYGVEEDVCFLCTFDGKVHVTYGPASQWGDITSFETVATGLATYHLNHHRARKSRQRAAMKLLWESSIHRLRD